MNDNEKLMAGFSYLGLILIGIPTLVILLMKKDESEAIKFHAIQALGFLLACFVLGIVLNIIGVVFMFLGPLAMVFGLVALVVNLLLLGYWIYLMIQAFQGNDVEVPALGGFIRSNFMK